MAKSILLRDFLRENPDAKIYIPVNIGGKVVCMDLRNPTSVMKYGRVGTFGTASEHSKKRKKRTRKH